VELCIIKVFECINYAPQNALDVLMINCNHSFDALYNTIISLQRLKTDSIILNQSNFGYHYL